MRQKDVAAATRALLTGHVRAGRRLARVLSMRSDAAGGRTSRLLLRRVVFFFCSLALVVVLTAA